MAIVSIIGHKGGVGKTTLSINIAAAITRALNPTRPGRQVCLFDLDLRLPSITGILNSHPQKTFYDLFETLANRTYQIEFLQTLYRILVGFKGHINGDTTPQNRPQLLKSLAIYKNLNTELIDINNYDFRKGYDDLKQVYSLFNKDLEEISKETLQNIIRKKKINEKN